MNLYRVTAECADRIVFVFVWAQAPLAAVCEVVRRLGLEVSILSYQAPVTGVREVWQYSRDLGEAFAFLLVSFTCDRVKALNPEAVQGA